MIFLGSVVLYHDLVYYQIQFRYRNKKRSEKMNIKTKIALVASALLGVFAYSGLSVKAYEPVQGEVSSNYWEELEDCQTVSDELRLLGYNMTDFETNADVTKYNDYGTISDYTFVSDSRLLLGCLINSSGNLRLYFFSDTEYSLNHLCNFQIHYWKFLV